MKKKLVFLIIFTLILVTSVACKDTSNKLEKNSAEVIENSGESNSELVNDSEEDTLKATAKEEGISEKKMESMIDELTEIGADKYGVTKEDYVTRIEFNSGTAFNEFKTAADFMGITISEYYEYEKSNEGNLTEDQKQTMAGMENALKEAEAMENPGIVTTDIEQMMGLEGNTSGEIRVVTGDAREMFSYKVGEVEQDYEDEYSILFEYSSDASSDDLITYYEDLLLNTEEYLKIGQRESPEAAFKGMINETLVTISIEVEGDKRLVNTYLDLTSKE